LGAYFVNEKFLFKKRIIFRESWVNELELSITIQSILNLDDMICVDKYSRRGIVLNLGSIMGIKV